MRSSSAHLIHNVDKKNSSLPLGITITIFILALVIGVSTGYFLSGGKVTTATTSNTPIIETGGKQTAGIADKETFKDKAEGILREGGIEGEGSFHLERPGGTSQNVYLTSTTVDLSAFMGKKVRVWGQTFQGQKAGWLMDVGYVESL